MAEFKDINKLSFKDLSFAFQGEDDLLENINYTFPENKSLRVVGGTGSGKSTLLKVVAGLLIPTAGDYFINDTSVGHLSFEEFTAFRLRIGYSFEFGGLLNNKTLTENILLPMQYHRTFHVDGGKKRVKELIVRAGLEKTENQRPSMVPGSHRKMTILLRALVLRPQLLILDEPTTGLTSEGKSFLLEVIKEEKRGKIEAFNI